MVRTSQERTLDRAQAGEDFSGSTFAPRPIIDESVVWADMDNEAVLLNVQSGTYFGLNEVGTAIWRGLLQDWDEAEIVLRLQEDFEVEPEPLRRDVSEFFRVLAEKGLISFRDTRDAAGSSVLLATTDSGS